MSTLCYFHRFTCHSTLQPRSRCTVLFSDASLFLSWLLRIMVMQMWLISSTLVYGPLHQQLLQSDTETPPYNPLKTQESWITAGENPQAAHCWAEHVGLLCKACRIIISRKHSLWRNKATCALGPLNEPCRPAERCWCLSLLRKREIVSLNESGTTRLHNFRGALDV